MEKLLDAESLRGNISCFSDFERAFGGRPLVDAAANELQKPPWRVYTETSARQRMFYVIGHRGKIAKVGTRCRCELGQPEKCPQVADGVCRRLLTCNCFQVGSYGADARNDKRLGPAIVGTC